MHLFVLILEGKGNFEGTGTLTMPSPGDMENADPADKDSLRTMKSVDVENMLIDTNKLEGRRGGFGLSV